MIVLDACAVVALVTGEPAAEEVRRLLAGGGAVLTAVGVAEVVDHLLRLAELTDEDAALDLAQFGLNNPPPLDFTIAVRAGRLRARHYHRLTRSLSMADCVVLATAQLAGAAVATTDPHLLDTCVDEGVDRIVLPDSRGARWSR
ncbi:MAG: PIN domain-containing protein [Acidimicrobiales bacterium]